MSEAKKPPIQDLTPRTQMMQMKSMQDMMQNGMKIRVEETDDERLGGPQKWIGVVSCLERYHIYCMI